MKKKLAIVLGVVGLVAVGFIGGAVYSVKHAGSFPCKAMQVEAKNNLAHAYTMQLAFHVDHDRYATTFEEMGFAPQAKNYEFTIVPDSSGSKFEARLKGPTKACESGKDVWTIDSERKLEVVEDCCQ